LIDWDAVGISSLSARSQTDFLGVLGGVL
jgi:hypothetical protein